MRNAKFDLSPGAYENCFIGIRKTYKFKVFKKNIKFKKFTRGYTKFIINRKKYVIRKRRTNFMVYSLITKTWVNLYRKSAQLIRFSQSLNLHRLMIPSSVNYYASRKLGVSINYSSSSVSKKLISRVTHFTPSFYWLTLFTRNALNSLIYLNYSSNIAKISTKSSISSALLLGSHNFCIGAGYTNLNNLRSLQNPLVNINLLHLSLTSHLLNLTKVYRRILITLSLKFIIYDGFKSN